MSFEMLSRLRKRYGGPFGIRYSEVSPGNLTGPPVLFCLQTNQTIPTVRPDEPRETLDAILNSFRLYEEVRLMTWPQKEGAEATVRGWLAGDVGILKMYVSVTNGDPKRWLKYTLLYVMETNQFWAMIEENKNQLASQQRNRAATAQ
jgi:hypothetical protein